MIDGLRGCARALPLALSMLAFGPAVSAQEAYPVRLLQGVVPTWSAA
jgi:hypothetical protein